MHVNTQCDVCDRPHSSSLFIVPDRDTHTDRWDYMCPLCLDAMLQLFPLNPRRFLTRELTGSYRSSTFSSSRPHPLRPPCRHPPLHPPLHPRRRPRRRPRPP